MEERPDCFGILHEVFPIRDSGVREIRERCIDCPYRLECLREALDTEEGIRMREEMLKRVPVNSVGDWLKRWSEKKQLSRMRQEKRKDFWTSLWADLKGVMFSPRSFFLETYDCNLKNAFVFGIITGSIGSMFSLFWKLILLADKFPSILDMVQESSIGSIDLMIFISFLFIPIVVASGILMYSFIIHLFLSIFSAGKGGIKGTISVISYSQASEIFSLIPMLGGIVAFIWRIYIQLVGLKYVHKTTYPRVIISFVFPAFLFILFIILLMNALQHMISGVLS